MRKSQKQEQLVQVYTVIPHNDELCTVHFASSEQANSWAKTYKDGANVCFQELPLRVVERKGLQIARKGYGL